MRKKIPMDNGKPHYCPLCLSRALLDGDYRNYMKCHDCGLNFTSDIEGNVISARAQEGPLNLVNVRVVVGGLEVEQIMSRDKAERLAPSADRRPARVFITDRCSICGHSDVHPRTELGGEPLCTEHYNEYGDDDKG
jgi:hypothetical protein